MNFTRLMPRYNEAISSWDNDHQFHRLVIAFYEGIEAEGNRSLLEEIYLQAVSALIDKALIFERTYKNAVRYTTA